MPLKKYSPAEDFTNIYFFEDFFGNARNTTVWAVRGGAGTAAIVSGGVGGQMNLTGNANNFYELYISSLSFSLANKFETSWRIKLADTTNRVTRWGLCGATSPAEAIAFGYDSTRGNWDLVTITGSSATQASSGVAADTNWHEFRIAGNTGATTWFIDNVPVGTATLTLPTGSLSPFCRSKSSTAATKSVLIDWMEVYGNRV